MMDNLEMNRLILSNPERRKEIAYHEAGHYVTYLAYSKRHIQLPHIELMTIKPSDSNLLGLVRTRPFVWGAFEKSDKIECDIKQILAGFAAEYFLQDHSYSPTHWFEQNQYADFYGYDPEATDDTSRALTSLGYIQELPNPASIECEDVTELLAPYFEASLTDVKKYWHLIEEVAKQILAQEEIMGTAIEELNESITERIEIELFTDLS